MTTLPAINSGTIPTDVETNRKIFRGFLTPNYKVETFETHDIEHALKVGAGYEQARDYNTGLYIDIAMSMKGKRGVYDAGSISKGMLANALAALEGPFHTKLPDGSFIMASHVNDMDETIGSQRVYDDVVAQNRRKQIQNNTLLREVFKGYNVLIPSALQGAVGVVGSAEFDRAAKRRDKDFMQVWTPVIRNLISIFPVCDDWFFSGATSGLEYPEAECVAAGLRKARPQADMWFLDLNGKSVSQYEIIRRRAEYLIWAAEQGNFYLKHEPTAFLRSCAIAEMAYRGQLPLANPVFLEGIAKNYPEIKYVEKELTPLVLERARARMFEINLAGLEDINPVLVKKWKDGKDYPATPSYAPVRVTAADNLNKAGIEIHRYSRDELSAGDFGVREIREKINPADYLNRTEADVVTTPMPQVDMKGGQALASDGQSIFSRLLMRNTNERERHQIITAIGGMETVTPPGGRSVYVVGDRNTLQKCPILERFRTGNNGLVFSGDFDDRIASFSFLRKMSMAEGEARPGQDAATLICHSVLSRRTTDFCFAAGWEKSEQAAQDIVLATRMQLGLQAGSPIDSSSVRVFDEKGHCLTLADRFDRLLEEVEKAVGKSPNPAAVMSERLSALVQIYQLHRFARDHALREQVIPQLRQKYPDVKLPDDLKWERITPYIFAYDHAQIEDRWRARVLPLLDGPAATAVCLRHMDFFEDVKALRERQRGFQELETTPPPRSATNYRHRATPYVNRPKP